MSVIGILEGSILARISAALTLPEQPNPIVDVRAWSVCGPDHKAMHPQGCVVLIYKGAEFSQGHSTAGHMLILDAEFELNLSSTVLPEPVSSGPKLHDLLELCRKSLWGWQPAQASTVLSMRRENFNPYLDGSWGYSLVFVVPLLIPIDRHCPPGPWVVAGPNSCCLDAPGLAQLGFVSP